MKKIKTFVLFSSTLLFLLLLMNLANSLPSNAQNINNDILRYSKSLEDVLRYASPNATISPRVAALGFSYYGISDDASAILFNPAGLSLVRGYELGLGFNINSTNTETNFIGTSKKQSDTEPYISNIQLAIPMQFSFVSLEEPMKYTVAISYSLETDFNFHYRWSGFNPQNSFIAEQASQKAYWLNYTKLLDTTYITDITKNVQQNGRVIEEGGLHNLTFGLAFDLSPNLAFGGALTTKVGHYQYRKMFVESDIDNIYNEYLVNDFNSLTFNYYLSQDVAAVTGTLGLQFRLEDWFRTGLSIKFPTYTYISEEHKVDVQVEYDPEPSTGQITYGTYNFPERKDYFDYLPYYINTPLEFSLGASANFSGATFSLATSYQDMSSSLIDYNIEDLIGTNRYNYFSASDSLNNAISESLSSRWTFGIGAEYKPPYIPIYIRASYTGITSSYSNTSLSSFRHIIGAGIGFVIFKNFSFESAFTYRTYKSINTNYGSAKNQFYYSYYDANFDSMNYSIGFRYRY